MVPAVRIRRRTSIEWLTSLALLATLAGCSSKTTAPVPVRHVHRSVTVQLADSLGTPVSNHAVVAISLVDSAGTTPVTMANTDASGRAAFVLRDGPWALSMEPVFSSSPARVAGCTFAVAGASRPEAETVLLTLRLSTVSRASGSAMLMGATQHQGTSVSMPELLFPEATTGASGAWELANLPPGTWNVVITHPGFGTQVRTLVVPLPGSNVAGPSVLLRPLAPAHAR